MVGLSPNSELVIASLNNFQFARRQFTIHTLKRVDILCVSRLYFFCGSFVFLCLVFLMLMRLFIAALWSPAGKGLTSWLLLVMFIVFLLLTLVVSWVRCGT